MPANKVVSVSDALSLVQDGMQLGLGGGPLAMNPVGLVTQLILSDVKDLDVVVAPIGGFAADLLIGAGAVRSVELAQLGFEELGMAPAFRQSVQSGTVKVLDHT
ncbi:coenzyme A transferase [Dethiobacter alkaliphilus AHT 1]|uniref:Coenzyme A transferase n=1 Tax=Dethiobacter alkaliphilus AHT 1 TaxID=555088 RepID=C0GDT5_DETAL|nr:coenzyme A transferase [Dethiobacter alkaliphilus AHT 1]